MTKTERDIQRKLRVLRHAAQIGDVSKLRQRRRGRSKVAGAGGVGCISGSKPVGAFIGLQR